MTTTFWAIGQEGFLPYEGEASRPDTWTPRPEADPAQVVVQGFVDLHIHGAYGNDFMDGNRSANQAMVDRLKADGYDGILLTTVTASLADVRRAVAALPDDPIVFGFHLEGPFISPRFPGAQPPDAILEPAQHGEEWEEIWAHPHLRRITLAPELPGSLALAQRLHARGVQVSMGHTNASYAEVEAGVAAGFRHATHMFNAMRPFHHRDAGTVGAALIDDRVTTELIYDRIHVCPESAKVLLTCKPTDKVVGISDCTRAKGLPPGTKLDIWGQEGEVFADSVRLASNGALAGSVSSLKDVFVNLAQDFGFEVAIRLCSLNPGRLLGLAPAPRLVFDRETFRAEAIQC